MAREAIRLKLVIVGDGQCGKTCLRTVFSKNQFPEDYTPTALDTEAVDTEVDGQKVELVVEDTGGQEGYEHLCGLTFRDSDIILLCFAIDSPDTLENAQEKWNPQIRHVCPEVPVILVGNKRDLRTDPATRQALRRLDKTPVRQGEGRAVARDIGAAAYVECSAKDNEGVRQVFDTAIRHTLRKDKKCSVM